MENSGGIKASLAGRYASALFDLASEAGTVTAVEGDLERLDQAIRESAELGQLLKNPQVSRDAASRAIDGVATVLGVAELTRRFLGTLAANRRLGALPDMIRAFATIAAAQRGEVAAEVTSAHALDDGQIRTLAEKLKAREGREVKLRTRVDPEILGGLVVRIGSTMIDSSIRTRLNTLSQAMKG